MLQKAFLDKNLLLQHSSSLHDSSRPFGDQVINQDWFCTKKILLFFQRKINLQSEGAQMISNGASLANGTAERRKCEHSYPRASVQ